MICPETYSTVDIFGEAGKTDGGLALTSSFLIV